MRLELKLFGNYAFLQKQPPRELGGNKVVKIYDYQIGVERDLNNNSEIPLDLPKANVLIFVTSEGVV